MTVHHLRAAGSSLVLDARGDAVPVVLHWGQDLGPLDEAELGALADSQVPAVTPSSVDLPLRVRLVPTPADGWPGSPGLVGWRPQDPTASAARPALRQVAPSTGTTGPEGAAVVVTLGDAAARLEVAARLVLDAHGVLEVTLSVTNRGPGPYVLDALRTHLPLPAQATEVLDMTGRWGAERRPQRHRLGDGLWSRSARHGRPGHDAPFVTVVGTPGFAFRHGEVWALHHAWSGDSDVRVERHPGGPALIGAGELWGPGEVVLAPGETHTSPRTLAAWSAAGLDGISDRFHAWVRGRPGRARRPRPLTLNTWEAVYFEHDLDRLRSLADAAADVGVERFVLDDGWFRGRRDDTAALGDWTVDPDVWPAGLHPLVSHVQSLGMEFGLWVEPEMVSLDSDLARAHPDWVLRGAPGRMPLASRNQQVLDLSCPGAYAHVRDALVRLLEEYPVSYLKWDQNRDVLDGPSRAQVLATRQLMTELRSRFTGVEIESCSAGGGRVDLDVLDRTDRVWASDTNDALERQSVQRWTGVLVPPELVGSHVGAARSHTTGRTHGLGLRLVTALFGHAGIEADLTGADSATRSALRDWAALVRELSGLVSTGRTVRADRADDTCWVHGLVSPDGSEGVFAVVTRTSSTATTPAPMVLPGLDARRRFRVERVELGEVLAVEDAPPPWWAAGGCEVPGAVLSSVGLPLPCLAPEQAALVRVRATP
ncbi:alpha-galactosidase [Isoptericola jiangsuensis]|uniref:alpha-galactosidase n=1 Tax=Isoptericola jiangsuensis TaxID=548579 RepID=UPI003AAECDB6